MTGFNRNYQGSQSCRVEPPLRIHESTGTIYVGICSEGPLSTISEGDSKLLRPNWSGRELESLQPVGHLSWYVKTFSELSECERVAMKAKEFTRKRKELNKKAKEELNKRAKDLSGNIKPQDISEIWLKMHKKSTFLDSFEKVFDKVPKKSNKVERILQEVSALVRQ